MLKSCFAVYTKQITHKDKQIRLEVIDTAGQVRNTNKFIILLIPQPN